MVIEFNKYIGPLLVAYNPKLALLVPVERKTVRRYDGCKRKHTASISLGYYPSTLQVNGTRKKKSQVNIVVNIVTDPWIIQFE